LSILFKLLSAFLSGVRGCGADYQHGYGILVLHFHSGECFKERGKS
jgi:hypothetical protein